MVASLCLLVACGGGGGGSSTSSAISASSTPEVSLTWTDPRDNVYPNNQITLLPQFSYGTAEITWLDENRAQQSKVVASNQPYTFKPTTTTTYYLTVKYQDPSTVRPTIKTYAPAPQVVITVTPLGNASPHCELSFSNRNPIPSSTVNVSSTCLAWSFGTIVSRTVTTSLESSPITENIPVVMRTPASLGSFSFTQTITYYDSRISATQLQTKTFTPADVINVTNDQTQVSSAGSMTSPRSDFAATAIAGNLILVTGGTNDGTAVLKTADIFDPGNTFTPWSATTPMAIARRGHTATRLPGGKVLVAGGTDGKKMLDTTEIYNPVTATWTASGKMTFARSGHTATVLQDGSVLFVGGIVEKATINGTLVDGSNVTEKFDFATETFSTIASKLPGPIQGHTATTLANGNILVVGRNNEDGTLTSQLTLIYDHSKEIDSAASNPAKWYRADDMVHGRYFHAATTLSDGSVMVSGGYDSGTNTTEIFTPPSTQSSSDLGTWTPGPNMINARTRHTTSLSKSGSVIAIGGYDGATSMSSIEILKNPTDWLDPTITTKPAWGVFPHSLTTARAMHNSVVLSGTGISMSKILVIGTYIKTSTRANSAELTPTTELVWSP